MAADGKEVDSHMLCKQDRLRSLDELHNDEERAFGSGLPIIKVPALHLVEQDHHLHRSRGPKILAPLEGGEATIDTMGAASSRIRLGD